MLLDDKIVTQKCELILSLFVMYVNCYISQFIQKCFTDVAYVLTDRLSKVYVITL